VSIFAPEFRFNVMAIRDAVTRDATLTSAPETTKWMVKHSDVVF
jgi:hypothetical protein